MEFTLLNVFTFATIGAVVTSVFLAWQAKKAFEKGVAENARMREQLEAAIIATDDARDAMHRIFDGDDENAEADKKLDEEYIATCQREINDLSFLKTQLGSDVNSTRTIHDVLDRLLTHLIQEQEDNINFLRKQDDAETGTEVQG